MVHLDLLQEQQQAKLENPITVSILAYDMNMVS